MANLYVREQGAVVRRSGRCALVEGPDGTQLGRVPIHRLEAVVVCGHVQVTTEFLHLCLEEGVAVSLLTNSGRILGRLVAPAGKDTLRRVEQVRVFGEESVRLALSRLVVSRKIAHSAEVLKQADWDRGDGANRAAREELDRHQRAAATSPSLDALRGIEGLAARAYFGCFGALLAPSGVAFPGRCRRPATDPVNAARSLAYTLLSNRLTSLLDASGIDPGIGFFHVAGHGRPSLALDLLEPLRAPLADRFVLRLFNRREVTATDFAPDADGGQRLEKGAYARVLERWGLFLEEKGGEGLMERAIAFARGALDRGGDAVIDELPAFAAR
jgi:CRISPR-associated protein Cas1